MILPFKGKSPTIHDTAFIAPGAHVIGDVRLDRDVSVWFTAVLRADLAPIRVGRGTNIQDGAVLHVDERMPCVVGSGVIIGHQASVHACRVGDGVLVGIGARILSGARIGAFSLIGAGCVVLENSVIPDRCLVLGVPGKVVRRLTPREAATHVPWAKRYAALARTYKKTLG